MRKHLIEDLNELYLLIDRSRVECIISRQFGIGISDIINDDWDLFDDLDKVEFIMEIEKEFDILISDVLAQFIISNIKLIDFLSNIALVKRDKKLRDLGI